MNRLFQSLGVVVWAWRSVGARAGHGRIWLPFLVIAAVQALVLMLLLEFHQPWLVPLAAPLVRLLGGEGALHYPGLFYALPEMFFHANLVITVVITSIAGAAATLFFARTYGFDSAPHAWRRALRAAPALVVATLVMVALMLGAARLATLVPERAMLENAAVRWGTRAGMMLLFVVIEALFAYTTAWIVLMGHRIWPSIRDSIRVTVRTLLPTLLVVGVPTVLLFPLSYAASRIDVLAEKFRPELVGGILGAQIVLQILFTFLVVGAVTRLFLWRMEAAR